jgi:hypothetical protein
MPNTATDQLRAQKDAAYHERNQLVAALSKLFPSHLLIHPAADATWEDGWRTIVCVHTPLINATWHIHDSERELVAHLEGSTLACAGWDGHSSEEKYQRLSKIAKTWQLRCGRGIVLSRVKLAGQILSRNGP